MYYRYKVAKKKKGLYKFFFFMIVVAASLFLGYQYKHYIMFWKYSDNKLISKIDDSNKISAIENREHELIKLKNMLDRQKRHDPVSPLPFFLSAKVHYNMGEIYLGAHFSDLFINDKAQSAGTNASQEFIIAIKDIKKGTALLKGEAIKSEYALVLAKSSFYTNYMSLEEINQYLGELDDTIASMDVENVRFCSLIKFLNGQQDIALQYLINYGRIKDSIQGQLFLATVQRMAKKYTNSIMNYKEALGKTTDGKIQKLIHVNLGRIYFTQGLYRESLDQFMLAFKIDDADISVKIWLGKNYSALGDKAKAKVLWGEVLNVDKTNSEAKNLLGIM